MSNPTLVLLYSLNSPKCNQFRSMIKDEYMSMFKPICVDNKQVREMLQNSTTLQIKTVPCVIEIFPDGNLASYEDIKAFEWITNFMSVIDKKPAPKQQLSPQNPKGPTPLGYATKIDDVFADEMDEKPQMPGLQGQGMPQSSRGINMNEIELRERNPNITALRGPRRSAYRGEVEDNQYMGISSERDLQHGEIDRPMRGMGHTGMNASSLSDVELDNDPDMMNPPPPPPRRQVPISAGGNRVKMIEDLTPLDEEDEEQVNDDDPSGMGIPRDDPVSGGGGASGGMNEVRSNKAKEKSSSLKNMASSIERARKMELEQSESHKQGGAVKSREMAMNEPINL